MSYVSQTNASRTAVHRHPVLVKLHRMLVGSAAIVVGMLAGLSSLPARSAVVIPQIPLSVGTPVPGNLLLTPSVEWPTIHTQANLGAYTNGRVYVGYFDANKCYAYQYDANEANRYFYPVSLATNGNCPGNGADQWSGNFLAWAATQTIDPFRLALTGGYRVRDTPTETLLEKARHSPSFGQYPNRSIADATTIQQTTPSSFASFNIRIRGLGNKMYFTGTGDLDNPGANLVVYDPATHNRLRDRNGERDRIYEVSVRVKVCVAGLLEPNCKQYSQSAKPEGLIQEYSQQLTYGIFGYLNDSASLRDGAALRGRQKFVGPQTYFPGSAPLANVATEWDATTGVAIRNPNPADAAATGGVILDSGVINYLNKFGQMTNQDPKSYDPVSEMFYAATRYMKNQGNVPEYTNIAPANLYNQADGFPVITNWEDPIRYRCQTNVILGIGDVYTWNDKNLPGSPYNGTEPARPTLVANDTTVNVQTRMQQIFTMENFGAVTDPFSGRNNSAYIAALAYDVHTRDIRPDLEGTQTISTHWVDVRENQSLENRRANPYWLAAKYGGFTVPTGFDPDVNGGTPLPTASWFTTGDILVDKSNNQFSRPDNFYVASDATKMVASLRRAFQNIVEGVTRSGSSLSSNSTELRNGSRIYQAQFTSGRWSGDLVAYDIDVVTRNLTERFRASANVPSWGSRKIFTNSNNQYRPFTYSNLSSADATALGSQEVVDYLRGDRTNESPDGLQFRSRENVLGDIIHSQPIFVGAPNPSAYYGKLFSGASDYASYASAKAGRRQVVYVGSNDGMLHGFDANTGVETYAFVPSSVIPNLGDYADQDYTHRYFVDGEITIADAYFGTPARWRSVLVGTLGRGGRAVYALDVTDPDNVQFLWEKKSSDVSALGNVLGKPIVAQVANGDWRVMVGNGPNGNGDKAQMIMFDLGNGTPTTVDTGVGSDNGLFGVNAWASGLSEFVDTVYAGDLRGNMWKFTNLTSTPTATVFFNANSGGVVRPITSAPTVAVNPSDGRTWVLFGTGSYITIADQTNRDLQQWFGLIDRGANIAGRSGLKKVSIIQEAVSNGQLVRITETNSSPGADGWYMDLLKPAASNTGERMVISNVLRGGAIFGVTRIPDANNDPCGSGGATSFIMALNPFTGGRLDTAPFDLNRDGNYNTDDGIGGAFASGFGTSSGVQGLRFVGDQMFFNLDTTATGSTQTGVRSQPPIRVSWRELIGN